MGKLENKVIWITGASSGIGLEMARQLAGQGNTLVLSARNTPVLDEIKDSSITPEKVHVLKLDLEQPDNFKSAVAAVYQLFGRVDIMIHNAGVSQRSWVSDTDISVDRRIMEINYFGTIGLTKALLPHMLANGKGHFVVLTSLTGKFGFGLRSAYAASKHALHGFFESLFIELGEKGIAVTMICPGPVQTNISVNALDGKGVATQQMDEMQLKGMPVDKAVANMIEAITQKKHEVVIGSLKEKLAVKLKLFMPGLFLRMARKQNPTGAVK
jgi:short-subunit dehydrogenase